jgi:hypothetical protein
MRRFGEISVEAVTSAGLAAIYPTVVEAGHEELLHGWREEISIALNDCDIFIGLYDIEVDDKQEYEYRLARRRGLHRIIAFNSRARQYRNKWAHGKLEENERNPLLEDLLRYNVVEFIKSHIEFQLTIRARLSAIIDAIDAGEPLSEIPPESAADSIVGLDDRIYEAVLRAFRDSADSQQKATSKLPPGSLIVRPEFPAQSPKKKYKSDVFVIMPFAPEFDAVFVHMIVPVCDSLGLQVKRGDDKALNKRIMSDVWQCLLNTRLVIADITGDRANVFYELGIVHTIGKPCIVITKDVTAIPFDTRDWRAIGYDTDIAPAEKFKEELRHRITAELNELDSEDAQ